jgi:hypothetical protein
MQATIWSMRFTDECSRGRRWPPCLQLPSWRALPPAITRHAIEFATALHPELWRRPADTAPASRVIERPCSSSMKAFPKGCPIKHTRRTCHASTCVPVATRTNRPDEPDVLEASASLTEDEATDSPQQGLHCRMDVLCPHRLPLIGQHLDDRFEHPPRCFRRTFVRALPMPGSLHAS